MFAVVTLLVMAVMRAGVPRGVILTALSLFFKNLRDKKHSNCPCFWRLTGQKPRYCCCWCCWCCCCCCFVVVVVVVVVDDDDVAVLVLNLVSCLCLCFLFLVFVLVLRRLLLSSSSSCCCCCCPSSFFLSLVVAENRQIGCVSAFFLKPSEQKNTVNTDVLCTSEAQNHGIYHVFCFW